MNEDQIQSKIELYLNGKIKKISGSENFVNNKLEKFTDYWSGEENKNIKVPNCLLSITNCLYNLYTITGKGILIFIPFSLILLILSITGSNIFDYLNLLLTKEILASLMQALITLVAIFVAIVVAFGNIIRESKIALWRNYFVHYFRYIFIVIVCDLLLLVLPSQLLEILQGVKFIPGILSLLIFGLNIYGIFLVISGTEKYFDEALGD